MGELLDGVVGFANDSDIGTVVVHLKEDELVVLVKELLDAHLTNHEMTHMTFDLGRLNLYLENKS